ncbi:DUF5682 family protein [Streptomyces sp. NBC_00582]|uniref:DUF5682 family protein n=1 Tax=Streptomyces sp. NBC_00582 TaxID=2975783 RepID=UPI002E809F04|nr:DUF5682 family protein [Streptomyces sp. NBC_00582]WUB62401.1 DUF5682 family protein [Streptomyces sp. NBC_00582]
MTGIHESGRPAVDARRPLLLGVRHHGPGSARAVRAALEAARPRTVLIEGPPEADPLIPLAAGRAMRPPVALLAHAVDEPGRSAFWPMAEFSPEWVALRWALERGVPARFIDLPATHTLAWDGRADEGGGRAAEEHGGAPGDGVRVDPLGALAEAAGYDDAERWWEDVVEHRGAGGHDPLAPFAAVEEAMTAVRETYEGAEETRELAREAYMRLQVRAAQKEFGDDGVAVVCGAWHVPALRRKAAVADDRALLKGLAKVRAELTWVPWTHRRLARDGGYGAGIDSPGWYAHLFGAPDRPVERWLTKVAGLLRAEDRIVSPAHVIEAVRLAGTLAALRGRPLPGLSETTDAVRAVLCDGSDVPLALVRDRLMIGDVLGEVPAGAPAVPLQRDLDRAQRRLRLKPEAAEREMELDLRKETDAGRSRLLHRLRLLGVEWGEPAVSRGGTGTFRETWRLRWEPELSVRVAEAGVWGTTVRAAATARTEADAVTARGLAEVTALAERCLLAGLPDALPTVMRVLSDRAALDTDVGHLAQALPALVRSLRYGDVRGTDTGALTEVAEGLAERVFVGLPPACTGLDADAAEEMRRHVDAVHGAVGLLEETAGLRGAAVADSDPAGTPQVGGAASAGDGKADGGGQLRARWWGVLRRLAGRDRVAGVVRGRVVRLLLDGGEVGQEEAARLMGLALSPGTPPGEAAAWIEGFVGGGSGGGLLLVHDERLLGLVDGWLTRVPAEAFTDVLPLLRRTFSAYEPGVRRTLGELVRRGPGERVSAVVGPGAGVPGFASELDTGRADAVLPVVRLLLGLGGDSGANSGGPENTGGSERTEGTEDTAGTGGTEGTVDTGGTARTEGTAGTEDTEGTEGTDDTEGTEDNDLAGVVG